MSKNPLMVVILGLVVCAAIFRPASGEAQDGSAIPKTPKPAEEPSPILASYDFEEPTPSGPDTFWLREREGGVDLSSAFRVHGERSLHLREVPGDRDFSEFLVYFDERKSGAVFVQFYLLLTDTASTLNVGLAGSGWFLNPTRHGHAVWIESGAGELRHRSAAGFATLFEPRVFTWYFIDLVYDVDRGRYDLAIFEEGVERPVVDVRGVRNYADADGSSVRYLSLIGDLEDEDRIDFFVDDLLVASDPGVLHKPFVAPGRRRFFVDRLAVSRRENEAKSDGSAHLERLEAAADLAFARRRLDVAAEIYERLSDRPELRVRMWLKLADVAHLRGDAERERELREAIYGRLDVED